MIGCHYKFKLVFAENMTEKKIIYKPVSKCCNNGKYHGCWSIYEDGTRKFISKKARCIYATDDPFWKEPKDVDFKIKTRSQKNKMARATRKDVLEYLTTEKDTEVQNELELKPDDYIVQFVTAW